ncbi:hypothetical protein M9458_052397 [Cirrhinus mrigala]|uniref:Uncharacterized protein n=1 Tax=Cirrhinus mrigala TaxID=683832 RepID=A0ABD0MRQ5_CIRMR
MNILDDKCTFGILATTAAVQKMLGVTLEMAEKAVKATCIFHTLLRPDLAEDHPHAPSSESESSASTMRRIHRMSSNNSSREAVTIRENFTQYFSSADSAVPWQENII